MLNKKTVSASSLVTYLACPYRYFLTYEAEGERAELPSNPDMIAGIGFHASMEYAFRQVLDGKEPTIASAVAFGMARAKTEWDERGVSFDSFSGISPASVLDATLTRVRDVSRWYLSNRFDTFYPLISEHRVLVDIPDRPGWQLDARIDLIEQDGSVVDFKLSGSKSPPHMDKADRSEQLSVYALARLLETGSIPPTLRLEYCRDGGKRIGDLTRGPSRRTEKDCERTLTRIQRVIDCIEAGVYPVASREGYECTGQRCQFFGQCPYGGK